MRPSGPVLVPQWITRDTRFQFVAVEGEEILGVCFCIRMRGNVITALLPRLAEGQNIDLGVRLLQTAVSEIHKFHPGMLIQTLVPAGFPESAKRMLLEAAFRPLATLIYLQRQIRAPDAQIALDERLSWLTYSRKTKRLFADVIVETYRGSLDCPNLDGLRRLDDIIETHKHTGRFTPKCWHVATLGSQPVGCILVNWRDWGSVAELVYMGVVSSHRGKGIGRQLVLRAIRDAYMLDVLMLSVAVDEANEPARQIYQSLGFVEVGRVEAFIVPPAARDMSS